MSVAPAALLIGGVAGLRTMTAPAATAWAAHLGVLDLAQTPFWFLGHAASPLVFTALAAGELVVDKLPWTPSRLTPLQLGARLASGAFCGAAFGGASGLAALGAGLGAAGALGGALAGASFRARLARAFRRDWPAALLEDGVALAGAALILLAVAR
jgi:uncharacterized membrane protein